MSLISIGSVNPSSRKPKSTKYYIGHDRETRSPLGANIKPELRTNSAGYVVLPTTSVVRVLILGSIALQHPCQFKQTQEEDQHQRWTSLDKLVKRSKVPHDQGALGYGVQYHWTDVVNVLENAFVLVLHRYFMVES